MPSPVLVAVKRAVQRLTVKRQTQEIINSVSGAKEKNEVGMEEGNGGGR